MSSILERGFDAETLWQRIQLESDMFKEEAEGLV